MDLPHRRLNPLTGEWVVVSPHRAERPWQGQIEAAMNREAPPYDPGCYLCPGNARAGGIRNPNYTSTFVFDNDFPALLPDSTDDVPPNDAAPGNDGLFVSHSERGICRVVCFTPRHDLTLSRMDTDSIAAVIDTCCDQARELEAVPWIRYVQVFENHGALMGASNPHPHCQIWASESIPNEIVKEQAGQNRYYQQHGNCLLCAYASAERRRERVVCANRSFLAVVPFWAVWPFEILLIGARHIAALDGMTAPERRDLAEILRAITRRYNALFAAPFPYSMGFHPAPARTHHPAWHLHAHFYPPLLRSPLIRKFMVGYELLANAQRDLTPEMAAARLREVAD